MKISIKQKSYIFVLSLVSVLLLILNYVISFSHQGYLKQMQSAYNTTFESFYANYISNLKSFYTALSYETVSDELLAEISTSNTYVLLDKAQKISSNIKSNEIFLNSANIILRNGVKISKNSILKIEQSQIDEIIKKINFNSRTTAFLSSENGEVFYKIYVGIYDKNQLVGLFEYILNPEKLISAIKEFDGTFSVITTKFNLIIQNDIDAKNNKNLFYLANDLKSEDIVSSETGVFFVKKTSLKDENEQEVIELTLMHDITKNSRQYHLTVKNSIYISIILFILTAILVNFIFRYLIAKLENSEQRLRELNQNLKTQVELESSAKFEILKKSILEAKKKEQLLMHQSRLAKMGEMIASIAHQWRQPLTGLGAILIYFDAFYEKSGQKNEKYETKLKDANELLKFMSNTINDFRNFYKVEREKELFSLKNAINSAIVIFSGSLNRYKIQISLDVDEGIKILGFKNEFSHVILNLLSNSRDAFLARNLNSLEIKIKAYQNQKTTVLICDNAGGINESVLEEIFDPYFSTKNYKFGTGMGLYISKMIIENNMAGIIRAKNIENGACFEIILENLDETL